MPLAGVFSFPNPIARGLFSCFGHVGSENRLAHSFLPQPSAVTLFGPALWPSTAHLFRLRREACWWTSHSVFLFRPGSRCWGCFCLSNKQGKLVSLVQHWWAW